MHICRNAEGVHMVKVRLGIPALGDHHPC